MSRPHVQKSATYSISFYVNARNVTKRQGTSNSASDHAHISVTDMLKVSFQNTVVLGIGLPTTLLMKLDTGGDTPPGIMQITDKDSEPAYAECLTLNWLAVSHSPIADIDAISHIPCTRSEFPDTPRSRGYFFSYPKTETSSPCGPSDLDLNL